MKTMATMLAVFWVLALASITVARQAPGEKRQHPRRLNHTTPVNASYAKVHLRQKRYHRLVYGLYGGDEWKYYVRNATLLLLHDQPRRGEPQGYYGCSRVPSNLDEIARLKEAGVRWVGLVDRGNCFFYQKVQFAAELGAVGLIVRSNSDELIVMSTIGNYIPSLMIRKTVGDAIQKDIERFGNGKIRIVISRVLQEEMESLTSKKEEEEEEEEVIDMPSSSSKHVPICSSLLFNCLLVLYIIMILN